jgi:transcriptional regulator of acetoin/glycerol metabolism
MPSASTENGGGSSALAKAFSSAILPAVGGNGNGHPPANAEAFDLDLDGENPLEGAERATLKLVLERCQWNFKKAAERLKLSRSTLYAKVSRYGLQRE